jgi:alginate O-acetyltransferase complex protein AlgI
VRLADIRFDGSFHNALMDPFLAIQWVTALALIAWFAPNTQQIMARYRPALGFAPDGREPFWFRWLLWRPSYVWSVIVAIIAVAALWNLWVGSNAEFIYFQF